MSERTTAKALHRKRCANRCRILVALAVSALLSGNSYLVYRLTSQSTLCPLLPLLPLPLSDHVAANDEMRDAAAIPHGQRPDWRRAVDCSVWDNMCGATSVTENGYGSYPFPIGAGGRRARNLDVSKLDHRPLRDVPREWLGALNVDDEVNEPPVRSIFYIYPPDLPATEASKCVKESSQSTWQMQIEQLLKSGRVKREKTTSMVAFTISDYNYAQDMMHDVFEMNSKIVGFDGSFFMVALDEDTVEMGCRYGYPVVAWHGGASAKNPSDEIGKLKRDVANTKFEVSSMLASDGIDFLFYEMDVWFLTSPKEVIAAYHGEEKHDILLSSHMKDPQSINIGVYSVTANERTKEFFELCILMAKESPGTHDQWIVGQLLLLAWIINETGKPSFTLTRMWYPPPKHNPPTMKNPPYYGMYNTMEIQAGERPIPTKNTIAIHPLCASPLKKPFGKKILAKELGAWFGFTGPDGDAGYYARTGKNRRYLWMDGHDSPNSYNTVQSFEFDAMDSESLIVNHADSLRWTMAVLLALARRTGRIFQMPAIISEEGAHYLWTVLDFETVDGMGIEYRETNFPHNKKSWHSEASPFRSVARTALAPLKSADSEGTMYVQHPDDDARSLRGGGGPPGEGKIRAWKFAEEVTEERALDAWWALHTAVPNVESAELLLVNPHFVSAAYTSTLRSKLSNKDYKPTVSEREIFDVYNRLKWCPGHKVVVKETVVGRSSAEMSCHGMGHHHSAFGP